MMSQCPKVTNEAVIYSTFQHSNQSLSGGTFRDLLLTNPNVFKELLEECLRAKHILTTFLHGIASITKILGVNFLPLYEDIFKNNRHLQMFNFHFSVKQKLLVTACKHGNKKFFADLKIPSVDSFSIDGNVYPSIFDESYISEENRCILLHSFVKCSLSSGEHRFLPGREGSDGLTIDDYHTIINNPNFISSCVTAQYLLEMTFPILGKVYLKSLNGIKEKVLYRQKKVNDICRVTIRYDDLINNLTSIMDALKSELESKGLKCILTKERNGDHGNPKLIFSFSVDYSEPPMWLEVQLSDKQSSENPKLDDHVDYELKRLERGPMLTAEMQRRFHTYTNLNLGEDNDAFDMNVLMQILRA